MAIEKRLKQERVTKYALLTAELDKLKKGQAKQRAKIIKLMQNGYVCPRRGPYLVILSKQERTELSWHDEWVKQAKKVFGKDWKKIKKGIITRAPKFTTPLLLTRVNPDSKTAGKVVEFRERGAA